MAGPITNNSAPAHISHLPLSGIIKQKMRERLPPSSVYRSLAGRAEFLRYYQKVQTRLTLPTTTQTLKTQFGQTHLTLAGDNQKPPLLVLPGMSVIGPLMVEFLAHLALDRYLIIPDLIGQPGLSVDRPMPHKHNAYGLWLRDILDEMNLKSPDMAAASFGGAIALDLASMAPERVGKLALIVPAGITPHIPYVRMSLKLFIPWLVYRQIPLRKALPALAYRLSRSMSGDDLDYLDLVLQHTAFWKHRPAGPFLPQDLKNYKNPVFLVQTAHDVMFPYAQTHSNARESLAQLETHFLAECAHMPGAQDMVPILIKMRQFLSAG